MHDGSRTLQLEGELDLASVEVLQTALARPTDGTRALTLDLSGLRFIDSSGLHAILWARDLCEQNGFQFSLVPGPAAVQRPFEVTHLLDVLPFTAA